MITLLMILLGAIACLFTIHNLELYRKDMFKIAKSIVLKQPKEVKVKNLTNKPLYINSYYYFLSIYTGLTKEDIIKYSSVLDIDLKDEQFWLGFDVELDTGVNFLDLQNIYHQVIFLFLYNHKHKDKLYEIEIKF